MRFTQAEVALFTEYKRLTDEGWPPGRETMERALANLERGSAQRTWKY